MTDTAKMKAEVPLKRVTVRANLAVLNIPRNGRETVTLTPMIQRAIDDGKLSLVDDEPDPVEDTDPVDEPTEPVQDKPKSRRRSGASGNRPV